MTRTGVNIPVRQHWERRASLVFDVFVGGYSSRLNLGQGIHDLGHDACVVRSALPQFINRSGL